MDQKDTANLVTNQNLNEGTPHRKKGKFMPKVAESLIVPVVLPVWSIICAVVVGAFGFGINYQQLSNLVKNQEKVDIMYERQVSALEKLRNMEFRLEKVEARIVVIERGK
jgi:hypothetical protein